MPGWVDKTPQWQGESLEGKTIVLVAEQGLGDMIFFSRFIACYEELKPKKIYFYVREPLKDLFQKNILKKYDVISTEGELKDIDFYAPLFSSLSF